MSYRLLSIANTQRRRVSGMYGLGVTVSAPLPGQSFQEYYASQLTANPETQGWAFDPARVAAQEAVHNQAYEAYVSDPCSQYNLPAGQPCDRSAAPRVQSVTPNYAGAAIVPISSGPALMPAAQRVYSPSVSFVNSRGGSTLYPGDTWIVSISGGKPNADVVVTGGKNGATPSVKRGTTDSSGRFTLSGKISSDELGVWTESWTVDGQPAGSFSFSVVAGPGGSTAPAGSPSAAGTSASSSASSSSGGATPPALIVSGGSSIPTWVWIVGAGVAIWALKGSNRG